MSYTLCCCLFHVFWGGFITPLPLLLLFSLTSFLSTFLSHDCAFLPPSFLSFLFSFQLPYLSSVPSFFPSSSPYLFLPFSFCSFLLPPVLSSPSLHLTLAKRLLQLLSLDSLITPDIPALHPPSGKTTNGESNHANTQRMSIQTHTNK